MRPKIATAIGSTIAVTVPNTSSRISMAMAMPISSLLFASVSVILPPSWPPASTCRPSAGSAAVSRIASASGTDMSPSAVAVTTVLYAVLPSSEIVL